jgi:hypothetical protein
VTLGDHYGGQIAQIRGDFFIIHATHSLIDLNRSAQ